MEYVCRSEKVNFLVPSRIENLENSSGAFSRLTIQQYHSHHDEEIN